MILLVGLAGFLLGALINLLADSLPEAAAPRRPHCPACGAPRPLVAWSGWSGLITGAGTCPYCGVPRPARALAVEAAAVVIALLLYREHSTGVLLWPAVLVAGVFLLITVIDIEHRLILHIVTVPSALAIGLVNSLDPARGASKTLLGGLAGLGIVFILYVLGGVFARLVARMRGEPLDEVAFGFGDVALAGVIGVTVGWPGVLVALVLGILAAGVFSALYVLASLIRGRYSAFAPIPYGPFLILGASVVYFGGREALLRFLPG